jgi:hypothetical protein
MRVAIAVCDFRSRLLNATASAESHALMHRVCCLPLSAAHTKRCSKAEILDSLGALTLGKLIFCPSRVVGTLRKLIFSPPRVVGTLES